MPLFSLSLSSIKVQQAFSILTTAYCDKIILLSLFCNNSSLHSTYLCLEILNKQTNTP